jgi:adenine/guanine phosphoribosyltransferase-like PRPP-binding protein
LKRLAVSVLPRLILPFKTVAQPYSLEYGEATIEVHEAAIKPGQRVLLVDDLADTGHTLRAVVDQLKNNYKPVTELRSAVIWTKGVSGFQPDYSVDYLPTNPWIHQPFEGYDSLNPEKLMEKWKV